MTLRVSLVLWICWVAAPVAVGAESDASGIDEIIISASRREATPRAPVPVAHIQRKADFFLMGATVESDSRDESVRATELRKTLRNAAAAAKRDDRIVLSFVATFETDDGEISKVVPFDLERVEDLIQKGYRRSDVSRVTVVVKTNIDDDDVTTLRERVEKFVESVDVEGRAVIDVVDEYALSLVNVEQYRRELIRLILEDARRVQGMTGEDFRIEVSGFSNQVGWAQVDLLELAIFFPYTSTLTSR